MQSCVTDLGFTETPIDKIVSASRLAPSTEVQEKSSYFSMAKSAVAQGESMFGVATKKTLVQYGTLHIAMMAPLWITRAMHLHEDIIKLSLVARLGRLTILLSMFRKVCWLSCFFVPAVSANSLHSCTLGAFIDADSVLL